MAKKNCGNVTSYLPVEYKKKLKGYILLTLKLKPTNIRFLLPIILSQFCIVCFTDLVPSQHFVPYGMKQKETHISKKEKA